MLNWEMRGRDCYSKEFSIHEYYDGFALYLRAGPQRYYVDTYLDMDAAKFRAGSMTHRDKQAIKKRGKTLYY